MLKVIDHKQFALFDYDSEPCNTFQLGDVLYRHSYEDLPEIGVVLQTFSDGDVRTDMWGMCSASEVSAATIDQVTQYRKYLVNYLITI